MAFTARTAALGEQDALLGERLEEVARSNGEALETGLGLVGLVGLA